MITFIASFFWSLLNGLHRKLYALGILKARSLHPSRVISVGNIQAGGSGKTPVVMQIASEAHQKGKSVLILTRGYRGRVEKSGALIEPREEDVSESQKSIDPFFYGDEVALLHERLPFAWILVGADRLAHYPEFLRRHGKAADVVILDDGFQHLRIARDLDLLLLTSNKWGSSFFRNFPAAMKNADLCIWTKGETRPVTPGIPCVQVRMRTPAAADSKQKYELLCAVADPDRVVQGAQGAGYRIEGRHDFPDHHEFKSREIEELLREISSRQAKVLMTGKDAVKLKALGVYLSPDQVLEPGIEFLEGWELWNQKLWA